MTDLLDASGAGEEYNRLKQQERWHAPPKQKIWLICTLSCPWGYEGWGQTMVRCNTREGWQKHTEFGKFHKEIRTRNQNFHTKSLLDD